MRIELLDVGGIDIVAYHVRERSRLTIRQRGDRVVLPDLADESDDLPPWKRMYIGLNTNISAIFTYVQSGTHVRDAEKVGVKAVHLE